MSEPKPEWEVQQIDMSESIMTWWSMRKYALDVGIIAERALIDMGVLDEGQRRFYNRDEWRKLTEVGQ